jgi:hypothetical protein
VGHTADKSPIARCLTSSAGGGTWRLRDLRQLLTAGEPVVQVDFLDTHPLIRPLTAYSLDRLCPA